MCLSFSTQPVVTLNMHLLAYPQTQKQTEHYSEVTPQKHFLDFVSYLEITISVVFIPSVLIELFFKSCSLAWDSEFFIILVAFSLALPALFTGHKCSASITKGRQSNTAPKEEWCQHRRGLSSSYSLSLFPLLFLNNCTSITEQKYLSTLYLGTQEYSWVTMHQKINKISVRAADQNSGWTCLTSTFPNWRSNLKSANLGRWERNCRSPDFLREIPAQS